MLPYSENKQAELFMDHFNNRKSEAFVEKWEGELKTSKIF